MAATLSVTATGSDVRVVTVSNPPRKNALDDGLLEQLADVFSARDVRAWVVTGEGSIFSSGYDLTTLDAPRGNRLVDERLGEVLDLITNHPAPSVAWVNGAAIGAGCELAFACDFRVGSSASSFLMPPARLGVVYARKGLARVVSRVGEQTARWLFLTGRRVDAAQAFSRGLLDVLEDDARGAAFSLAEELAQRAPLAMSGMKEGLRLLEPGAPVEALERYEALRRASFSSDDAREGVAAMLEKRPPRFTGR